MAPRINNLVHKTQSTTPARGGRLRDVLNARTGAGVGAHRSYTLPSSSSSTASGIRSPTRSGPGTGYTRSHGHHVRTGMSPSGLKTLEQQSRLASSQDEDDSGARAEAVRMRGGQNEEGDDGGGGEGRFVRHLVPERGGPRGSYVYADCYHNPNCPRTPPRHQNSISNSNSNSAHNHSSLDSAADADADDADEEDHQDKDEDFLNTRSIISQPRNPILAPKRTYKHKSKDIIKALVSNHNLRAILAGKPWPKGRKKAGAEKPVLRMGEKKEYK